MIPKSEQQIKKELFEYLDQINELTAEFSHGAWMAYMQHQIESFYERINRGGFGHGYQYDEHNLFLEWVESRAKEKMPQ